MNYVKVEDSIEAALCAGILGVALERNPWVIKVEADENQIGPEAEMFVHMRYPGTQARSAGQVILRLHVTEVEPSS